MKVHIEGNVFLESDEFQFIIKEYTGSKDKNGNPTYKTHGYFTSLQSAIKALVTMKIKESTAKELETLIEEVRKIYEMIEEKISVRGVSI